jgi:pimeloyl-ACP methyl ester carboxylesterase
VTAILWLVALVLLLGLGLAGFTALVARRVEASFPPQGRFVEVDGNRIHYIDEGAGPPIVMIHGLGGQIRHFTYALASRLTDRYRVIVIDRPGAGYSDRPRGTPAGLVAQAGTIAGFIRALQLDRPLLVGHSLGGAIGLAMALDHPAEVGGLVLISALTQPQGEVPPLFRRFGVGSPTLRWLASWTIALPMAILGGTAALKTVFGPEPPPRDFPTRGGGLLSLRPVAFYNTSADFMAANGDLPGLVARYPTLTLPVGIQYGTADGLLSPPLHVDRLRAQIPGLEVDLIDGAGHMLPLTQPERTAAFIRHLADRVFDPPGNSG